MTLNFPDNCDELLSFADNEQAMPVTTPLPPMIAVPGWKILIVDDQEEVHQVTKLALRRFAFEERPLQFVSAYSTDNAKALLHENPDIAVILLDVVMEEEDSGLKMVKYIRDELKNHLVRIILRTGQPGQAPEQHVIMDYDINDYKEKTELTAAKLITAIVTSLRSYRDLSIINSNRHSLNQIIAASATIFELQSMRKFASAVLTQLTTLLRLNNNALYCHVSGVLLTKEQATSETFHILAGCGDYEQAAEHLVYEVVPSAIWSALNEALQKQHSIFYADYFVIYFRSKQNSESLIYAEHTQTFSDWDLNLLEIFCMNVSIAFDNIALNQEVEATQREIIFTLGEITEARSQETGFHVKRVAEYAKLLGLKYGLSTAEAEILCLAAPLHDIGKLGIGDAILNKPGKLTVSEFATIKEHSEIGYEMLNKSRRSIIQAGALIAHQHHERYDGSGYPLGLKGTEIHIYSRIVSLADVFDALGSKRVYKDAWDLKDIIALLNKERGLHFDPQLVDLFLANLDDFLAIRARFPDQS